MKAKTRQELASLYGIDRKTFSRWLKKRNIVIPEGLINPKDQCMIFEILGNPAETNENDKLPVPWGTRIL